MADNSPINPADPMPGDDTQPIPPPPKPLPDNPMEPENDPLPTFANPLEEA